MSRRILAVTLVLGALAGSSAFASRATVIVKGQGDGGVLLDDTGGSLYYDDARNIFYNPAYVNDFKNWATIEKSNYPGTTAEGGFVTSVANFNLGAYVNRGSWKLSQTGSTGVTTPGYTQAPLRPIELFAGSDLGMAKWGLGFSHASNSNTGGTTSDMQLSLGASIMNFEPFFAVKLQGKDPSVNGTHNAWRVGARYRWGEWSPYAAYKHTSENVASGSHENTWGVGLGRSSKIAEGVRMDYAVSYWRVSGTDNATGAEPKHQVLPVDFAVEGDAASWLTLRGGVGYHLIDKVDSTSAADATSGRLGATLHVGKADFDFAVGHNPPGANLENKTATGTATASANVDTQVFDMGTGLFSAASFSYHW